MPNKNAEITVKKRDIGFESGQKVNFGDEITVTRQAEGWIPSCRHRELVR